MQNFLYIYVNSGHCCESVYIKIQASIIFELLSCLIFLARHFKSCCYSDLLSEGRSVLSVVNVNTDLQTSHRRGNVLRSNILIASELIFKYYYREHLRLCKNFCCEQTETTVEMSSGVLGECDAQTTSKPHDVLPDGVLTSNQSTSSL